MNKVKIVSIWKPIGWPIFSHSLTDFQMWRDDLVGFSLPMVRKWFRHFHCRPQTRSRISFLFQHFYLLDAHITQSENWEKIVCIAFFIISNASVSKQYKRTVCIESINILDDFTIQQSIFIEYFFVQKISTVITCWVRLKRGCCVERIWLDFCTLNIQVSLCRVHHWNLNRQTLGPLFGESVNRMDRIQALILRSWQSEKNGH